MNRLYFNFLTASFVVFLHDIFDLGDGFYLVAGFFAWRGFVVARRLIQEAKNDRV